MGRPKKARAHHGHGHVQAAEGRFAGGAGCRQEGYGAAVAALQQQQRPGAGPAHRDNDSEEDEEAAEFRREAAELLRQRQQQQRLPGGLHQKQLDAAIKMLVAQIGVSKQLAEDALLATAEEHCKNPDEWYNEAGMWLAVQNEVQDEAAELKAAMEVSLREQQAAREAEESAPPIALMSEERLRKKFKGSTVLARLDAVLPSWVLFSERMPLREKVKHKLVELLKLEADCIKWWPDNGTQKYFEDAAARFCEQLHQASSSRGSVAGMVPAGAGAAPEPAADAAKGSAAASKSAGGAQPAQGNPAAASADAAPQQGREAASAPPGTAAPAAAHASSGARCTGGGNCRPSPEAEAASEPCSKASSDGAAAAEDDGNSVGARAGKRKRQPPARYRSPSPAVSTDSRKRQQRTSPDSQPPTKRQASVDCHAAAAKDSSAAGPSVSPSPAAADPPAGEAAARQSSAPDSTLHQDRGAPAPAPAQLQPGMLPPLPSQQQQSLLPQPAAHADGADPMDAYLPAGECLSQLLDEELQQLRHHVYNMPEKACAVPVIFQTADDQQEPEGEDSDIELVDVKQPAAGGPDIPEPPSPVAAHAAAATPASTPAAGVAAAGQVGAAPQALWQAANAAASRAAAAAAAGTSAPQHSPLRYGLSPDLASLYAAAMAGSSMSPAAGPPGQQQQQQQHVLLQQQVLLQRQLLLQQQQQQQQAGRAQLGAQQSRPNPGDFEYRASTNEQGTLVIEID